MLARLMRSNVMVSVVTMLASLSGLALALGVPMVMPARDYTHFAALWAIGQLVASIGFEWMRFGVLRFGMGADQTATARRRAVLWICYLFVTTGLLVLAAGFVAASFLGDGRGIALALVVTFAAMNGAFDGHQALMRAEMRNAAFSAGRMLRTLLGFCGAMSGALIWGSVEAVMAGMMLSFPLTLLLTGAWRDVPRGLPRKPENLLDDLREMFLFGVFAAMTTNLAMLLPALYRVAAVRTLGPDAAAGFVLGFDLAQKMIAVVGFAVNVVVMQTSIRVAEFETGQAARGGRQLALTLAMVAPATVGFYLIGGPLAELGIAPDLRAGFLEVLLPATITAGLLSFRMFSVDPLFIVRRQTSRGTLGAGVTVLGVAVLLLMPALSREAMAWAITAAMALGVGLSFSFVARGGAIVWPWADLAKIAAGCAVMVLVTKQIPALAPAGELAATFLLSVLAYGSIVLATDAGGLRTMMVGRSRG